MVDADLAEQRADRGVAEHGERDGEDRLTGDDEQRRQRVADAQNEVVHEDIEEAPDVSHEARGEVDERIHTTSIGREILVR